MAVRVNILTTYNGAGQKKALRDLALMQRQAKLAGNGVAAGMLTASAATQRAGASMAQAGATMSRRVTLPIVAIGALSVIAAAKFEDSMKLIQTQAGGSKADVEELSAAVLELGAKGQHGPNELAAALYHLKSVGMDNATAMKALTQSERLASVGHADLEATTNAVAGAYKSGIKGAQNFGVTVGTLNAIIGAGNLRMEDLNAALGTGFLVTAKTFGVSLTSVGAALAMMTSRGIPATRAAMALKMAFSGIAAPSDKAEKIMSKLHLSSKKLAETLRSGGMLPALTMLKDKLKGLSKTEQSIALTKMFGAKSSQAILTLLGNLKDYDRTLKQVRDNTGKFSELAAAQSKDATAKWDHFKSSMSSAAVLIGNQLLPTAISLADRLGAVGAWLNKLSPGTRRWVVGLGLIVGVAGPVLLIVGKMTLGIGKLIGTVGKLALGFGKGAKAAPGYARALAGIAKGFVSIVKQGVLAVASIAKQAAVWVAETAAKVAATAATIAHAVATKAAAAAQWLLNAALSANPIGLIIAAVAALVAIVVILWKKNETFRRIVTAVWEKVKSAVSALVPVLMAVGKVILGALSAVWKKVSAAVKWFWGWAGPFITKQVALWWAAIQYDAKLIYGGIKWLWTTVSAAVKKFWKWAGPFIKTAVKLWWTQIKTTFAAIKVVTVTAWNAIKAVVQTAIRAIVAVIHGVQAVVGFLAGVWNSIKSGASSAVSAVVGFFSGIGSKIKNAIGSAAKLLYDVGKQIVQGLKNGIVDAWHFVTDKIKSLIGGLSSAAKKLLGIGSPSRVFAAIGQQIAQGLANGMTSSTAMVRRASQAVADASFPAFGGPGGLAVAGGGYGRGGGVVVSRGAVQVQITVGAGVQPGQVRTAARSGVEQALVRLAREINAT